MDNSNPLNVCTNCTVANPNYINCQSSTYALSCVDGYYLVANDCVTCSGVDPQWASCNAVPEATSCISGWYLDNADCSDCTALSSGEVETCSSATVHITCTSSYLVINDTCTLCSTYNAAWSQCQ